LPDSRPEPGEFFAPQWTRTQLCLLLRDYFRSPAGLAVASPRGPIRVGTDVVFHYDPADRLARVTPDLYVIEGLGYEEQLRTFRVHERGLRPSLVIHLVDSPQSPEDGLMRHFLRLGVGDVVLYDPLWWQQPGSAARGRRLLTHYRRSEVGPAGAALELVSQEHPGRLLLPRYRLWLVHRGGAELRIYTAGAVRSDGREDPPSEAQCWPLADERADARPRPWP
jgi:Uma2 family endonuclease